MISILTVSLVPLALGLFLFHSEALGPNALPLLSTYMALPLVAALASFWAPARLARWATLFFASAQLGLALKIFCLYQTALGGYQFTEQFPGLEGLGLHYALGVDGLSAPLLILVSAVYWAGVLASWDSPARPKEYFAFFSLMTAGAAGAFLSLDLFFFFLFYELDILPMFLLIGIWGSGRKQYAATKFALYLVGGSALILVGFLALHFASGINSFDIRVLGDLAQTGFSPAFQNFWFPVLGVGFGVLLALIPFHTWSPDAYASAPTAASMMNAGVLKTLGGYGLLRVALPALPDGAKHWLPLFAVLAVLNMLYASLVALRQKDIKYVVAYSSVAHCGYLVLGICTLEATGFSGAALQMVSQGLLTAFAFGLVGLIENRTGTRQWEQLGGLSALAPVLGGLFMLNTMANVGLPGFSSFVAEFMVFLGAFRSGFEGGFAILKILFPIAVTAIVIGAVYYLRLMQNVFFGPVRRPTEGPFVDLRSREILPLVLLLVLSLAIGLYPKPWADMVNSSLVPLIDHLGGFK
ncbi:MAG TPA: NADH-quinone oxidoreductase subunit M [bacterium]|nr:NADH-quinone oxidoreductase subunit M [bacterium]